MAGEEKEMMRKAFTLVELLVVVAMIAILMGAASSVVAKAQKRARIARAEADVREMTNAILAYENWDKKHSLSSMASGSEQEATDSSLSFILGGKTANGNKIPVLYNAAVSSDGSIRDPWGTPYRFKIEKAGGIEVKDSVIKSMTTVINIPNMYRLSEEERR